MNRKTLLRLTSIVLCTALLACDKGDAPAKAETKDAKAPAAPADKAGDSPAPDKDVATKAPTAAGVPDPCSMLDEAVLRTQLGLKEDAKLDVGDKLDASRANDDAKSCTWSFDGKMIALQVTIEPSGNKFDTWASRLLEAKKAHGFESVEGLADGAVFGAKDSHLMFRQGESRLFSLSYAGDRPGASLGLEKLKPIAASVAEP